MDAIRDILLRSQPLLLFVIIGLGYIAGQIRIKGVSLGIAGVLFAGLAFGAWTPEGADPLVMPHAITDIGLILFVYAVGLTSGPGFFESLRARGLRANIAMLSALLCGAVTALLVGKLLGVPITQVAGAFCGGLTNTPALAAVNQLVGSTDPAHAIDPTLGYSVTYPFGVLGALLSFQVFASFHRKSLERERSEAAAAASGELKLVSRNYQVTNPALFGKAIGKLRIQDETGLIVSRFRQGGVVTVPTKYTVLNEGDVLVAVGRQADIDKAVEYFGAASSEQLELNREHIEMRRILVSKRDLAGKTIEELELDRRFNAQITRLRRADIDIVPSPNMTIELGDRLRVVMPREKTTEVAQYFGDSERHIAELDYTAITLGISLGVLVGMIPVPLPGGGAMSLGFAGGPLVVALILGKIGRTGPLVWSIPLESNQAIRHVGLLFFLAGVGLNAGGKFLSAVSQNGLQLLLLGAIITVVSTFVALALLRQFASLSVINTMGATSGMQTQPATLAKAFEITKSDDVYVSYATTYPAAMIGKIILAQLIVVVGKMLWG